MFFKKNKTKTVLLPIAQPEDNSKSLSSQVSIPGMAYNESANQFARASDKEGRIQNYAIYYRDRDLAQSKGDPMITMIQAYSLAQAQLEALKMQKDGCEILTIQSNEAVEYPTQATPVALPAQRMAGQGNNKSGGAGSVFRAKHNLLRGF